MMQYYDGLYFFFKKLFEVMPQPLLTRSIFLSIDVPNFAGSRIITGTNLKIATLLEGRMASLNYHRWTLCYSGNVHGWSSYTFHSYCNYQGLKLVVFIAYDYPTIFFMKSVKYCLLSIDLQFAFLSLLFLFYYFYHFLVIFFFMIINI